MKNLRMLVLMVVMVVVAGCCESNVVSKALADGVWRDTGFRVVDEKGVFTIEDLKFVPTSASTAIISGRVPLNLIAVSYEQKRRISIAGGVIEDTRFIRKKIPYVSETLVFDNPVGSDLTVYVSRDGSFEGTLVSDKNIFFEKPNKGSFEKMVFTMKVDGSFPAGNFSVFMATDRIPIYQ